MAGGGFVFVEDAAEEGAGALGVVEVVLGEVGGERQGLRLGAGGEDLDRLGEAAGEGEGEGAEGAGALAGSFEEGGGAGVLAAPEEELADLGHVLAVAAALDLVGEVEQGGVVAGVDGGLEAEGGGDGVVDALEEAEGLLGAAAAVPEEEGDADLELSGVEGVGALGDLLVEEVEQLVQGGGRRVCAWDVAQQGLDAGAWGRRLVRGV
jgi:hypothetical protein